MNGEENVNIDQLNDTGLPDGYAELDNQVVQDAPAQEPEELYEPDYDDYINTSLNDIPENTPDVPEETPETAPADSPEVPENPVDDTVYKVKANGQEYDFTLEQLQTLASKGMDYTKKTQKLKPFRTMINAIESNGITADDIDLLIDLKKGNKHAIGKLINDNSIDPYDLPSDEEIKGYTPTRYGKSEETIEWEEAINTIRNDEVFAQTDRIYSNLDKASKDFLYQNPKFLVDLNTDVKTGTYYKVLPMAEKLAALDDYSKPDLEYYVQAGGEYYKKLNEEQQVQQRRQQAVNNDRQARKKAAAIPATSQNTVSKMLTEEEQDAAYYKWLASLEQQY